MGSLTHLALSDLQRRAAAIRSTDWTNLRIRNRLNRLISLVSRGSFAGQVSTIEGVKGDLQTVLSVPKNSPALGGLDGLTPLMNVFTFAKSYSNPLLFKYLGLLKSTTVLPALTSEVAWSSSVSALVYSTHQVAAFSSSARNLSKVISSLDTPMSLKVALRRRIAYTLGSDIRSSNINYFYGRFLSEFIEHTTGRHSFVKLNPAIESGLTFSDKAKLAS